MAAKLEAFMVGAVENHSRGLGTDPAEAGRTLIDGVE